MTNAAEEFIEHFKEVEESTNTVGGLDFGAKVLCAKIIYSPYYDDSETFCLKMYPTADDLTAFLKQLDFEYDSGYGSQELYGTIWYYNGTWSERGEYDGSEWWTHHSVPSIPAELQQ